MIKNNLPTLIGTLLVGLCGTVGTVFPEYAPIAAAVGTLISAVVTKIAHGMTPPEATKS